MTTLPTAERVDVMLLLEGPFPYVSGGVSSWVNQIIRGFPDLTFGAVFLAEAALFLVAAALAFSMMQSPGRGPALVPGE